MRGTCGAPFPKQFADFFRLRNSTAKLHRKKVTGLAIFAPELREERIARFAQ
jgi:hypothetical protein